MARQNNVLEYLDAQEALRPDEVAFADANSSVTYAQLAAQARAVGSFVAARAQARRPVAVLADKSCAVVAAFLGIVSTGCFYTLLDPKHPTDRLKSILETLEPALILIDGAAGARAAANLGLLTDDAASGGSVQKCAPGQGGDNVGNCGLEAKTTDAGQSDCGNVTRSTAPKTIPTASLAAALAESSNIPLLAERRSASADTDPLYVMFTSGSTGKPKGVLVCHRSVLDFIDAFAETFGFDESDVLGNQAPFDFDVSTKDIYTGLKCGARVELLEKQLFSFPTRLVQRLEERGVTALVWAVSALVIVSTVDALAETQPGTLKKILFSGETMPVKHLSYWRTRYPNARFVNLYGPTEITCNCTYYELRPGDSIEEEAALPIGVPFPNERVFLLDEENREIKLPGETGELCVAGSCLALGYLRDPERTAAAFCQNPLQNAWPERVYRTGDLACYGEDGLLYFRSRRDFQIKHMGHRIELQEIELHVQAVPGVDRCCCVFFQEQQKVVAFYEGTATARELTGALRKKLPAYMIPQAFELLERLPITDNGKIDRAKLRQTAL